MTSSISYPCSVITWTWLSENNPMNNDQIYKTNLLILILTYLLLSDFHFQFGVMRTTLIAGLQFNVLVAQNLSQTSKDFKTRVSIPCPHNQNITSKEDPEYI